MASDQSFFINEPNVNTHIGENDDSEGNEDVTNHAETTHSQIEVPQTGSQHANVVPETSDLFGTDSNDEMTFVEVLIPADSVSNIDNADETESDPLTPEPVPLFEPIRANDDELNELLDEEDLVTVAHSEDITFVIDSKVGNAKPIMVNTKV